MFCLFVGNEGESEVVTAVGRQFGGEGTCACVQHQVMGGSS